MNPEPFLLRITGCIFYDTSPVDLKKLAGDPGHVRENLLNYVQGFSPAARDIFERFEFHAHVDRLAKAKLLYQVRAGEISRSPRRMSPSSSP